VSASPRRPPSSTGAADSPEALDLSSGTRQDSENAARSCERAIDGPDNKLLFAIAAVEGDHVSADDIARAVAEARFETAAELGNFLESRGLLKPERRLRLEQEMLRLKAGNADTMILESKEPVNKPLSLAVGEALSVINQGERYQVRHVSKKPGAARVVLVHDSQMGREVVLKELPATPTLPHQAENWSATAARFLREARVTAQLEHPNIVPVYEMGRRPDGALYYTMRFVRGKTLGEALDECELPHQRLRLLGSFWDICNAVAFAHSKGVVHRDLKPHNVMVGEFGETVLLDWGIAKVTGQTDPEAEPSARQIDALNDPGSAVTMVGTAIGTPAYMSPEQALGQKVDHRSDVWGLGAILYQILTGRPPFQGKTSFETIRQVVQGQLVPVCQVVPEAPPELAGIAEKAMSRDIGLRYQSAKELAEDVSAYLTGGRVRAHQYTSWELLKRFAEKNRMALAAAALVFFVIIGALVAVSVALRRESLARALEHKERLVANYHLAQAYAEKSAHLVGDRALLDAGIYAAAALQHNPAHAQSPYADLQFAATTQPGQTLTALAAGHVYAATLGAKAHFSRTLVADEPIHQVAISPDGKLLVAAVAQRLLIYDLATGAVTRALDGHNAATFDVTISHDGKLLASCDRQGVIKLWDLGTGELVRSMQGGSNIVSALSFSPDDTRLAAASRDRLARLWDTATGNLIITLSGHTERINDIEFFPDGASVITTSFDNTARVWDARSGRLIATLQHPGPLNVVSVSPKGDLVAVGASDRKVFLWDAKERRLLASLEGHHAEIFGIAFSPDGSLLATTSWDKSVRLWDVAARTPLLTLGGHQDFVVGAAFSPDGSTLATASLDKTIRLWRIESDTRLRRLKGHTASVAAVAFSPDGKRVASGGWDNVINVWEVDSGRRLLELRGHTDSVQRVTFFADGKRLASASNDHTVRLWDLENGASTALTGPTMELWGLAVTNDGATVAAASYDKSVWLWSSASGQVQKKLQQPDSVLAVAFAPDGKTLAASGYDRTVQLWDVASGVVLGKLTGHSDWVSDLVFSRDGARLASSSKDRTAILWDVAGQRQVARMTGHTQWANVLSFSPDEKMLVTASDDMTLGVWETTSGAPLMVIRETHELVSLAFSPDGRYIAAGSGTELCLYPVDLSPLSSNPTELLGRAEKAAGLTLDGFALVPTAGAE
jgi:eukaryotic-like serine/threonine-protein kinase